MEFRKLSKSEQKIFNPLARKAYIIWKKFSQINKSWTCIFINVLIHNSNCEEAYLFSKHNPSPKSLKNMIQWFEKMNMDPGKATIMKKFLDTLSRPEFELRWAEMLRDSHARNKSSDEEGLSKRMKRLNTVGRLVPAFKNELKELLEILFQKTS